MLETSLRLRYFTKEQWTKLLYNCLYLLVNGLVHVVAAAVLINMFFSVLRVCDYAYQHLTYVVMF